MSDPNKILFKDFSNAGISFKDVDGKKGIVTGYFANFDSIDSDGDIIKSGAFTSTITGMGPTSPKPRIKHLINHNPEQPVGLIMVLKEDKNGLYYESKAGTHSLGRDFLLMAESGLISEHSIGFKLMKFNQIKPWDEWEDGEAAREITEVKLYEGSSLTAWGANENTPLTGIKSDNIKQLINKAKAIDRFCSESKATDETIESLLLYNKELLQTIKDLQTNQGSPDPAENGSHSESEVVTKVSATLDCPNCLRFTYNTMTEKGYCKCHRCSKIFVPGGPALSI